MNSTIFCVIQSPKLGEYHTEDRLYAQSFDLSLTPISEMQMLSNYANNYPEIIPATVTNKGLFITYKEITKYPGFSLITQLITENGEVKPPVEVLEFPAPQERRLDDFTTVQIKNQLVYFINTTEGKHYCSKYTVPIKKLLKEARNSRKQ